MVSCVQYLLKGQVDFYQTSMDISLGLSDGGRICFLYKQFLLVLRTLMIQKSACTSINVF